MNDLHVICKIADSEYAVPANDVYQMESFSGVTAMPGAPAYVAGLVQVRQQVVPVIDTRIRFGLSPSVPTADSRLVVLKIGNRLVSLLVDSAREVQKIGQEQFTAPPAVLAQQTHGFVKAIAQIKGRIIMLLDSLKVIGEESSDG